MMKRAAAFFTLACSLHAQIRPPATNSNAEAAYESLLRLRTTATVLHTTAHPDDEDGGLITWLARAQGVRTGLFTFTRGEGGANRIGPELFDALGILRTEELLAADRYYGVDQFFGSVADFGFSKRLDETLEMWGKEDALRDCVRVLRMYRPDVIISRFEGSPRDGHGNHQGAGLLTSEAFRAAADPNRFPEQFREGLRPWRAKRLYRSVRANGPATIKIDTGVYAPMMGASYQQVAQIGLSLQRSQHETSGSPRPGRAISALALVESVVPEKAEQQSSIFDGIDTSLSGLAQLAPSLNLEVPLGEIEKDVARAIEEFDARDPSRLVETHIAPALRNLRAVIRNVSDSSIEETAKDELLFRLRNKEDEFVRAANLLTGISFEVSAGTAAAIPGGKFSVTEELLNRSNLKIENVELGLTVRGRLQFSTNPVTRDSLANGEQTAQQFQVSVDDEAALTQPYWSRQDEYRDRVYHIDPEQYRNLPFAPPEITGTASYRVGGVRFSVTQPAMSGGHVVAILPAISVALSPRIGVIALTSRGAVELHAKVMSNVDGPAEVKVHLEIPPGPCRP